MHRIARLVLPSIAILLIGVVGGAAAPSTTAKTKQDAAKKILSSPASQNLTATARGYVESVARNDHRLVADSSGLTKNAKKVTSAAKPGGGGSLANVRVNNPANDSHQVDQTTQSETAIAVSGSHVVVGYNDSQQAIQPFLTAGADLNGYAYSADGGQTFTDGGTIPNAPGNVNLGDPWLAADSSGTFYYSSLVADAGTGNLVVGVATSGDGGKTFGSLKSLPQPAGVLFYSADKDAMATGTGKNVYIAWDDFSVDSNFNFTLGLPVAHSTDSGQTWSISYADQTIPTGCSFAQYIGAVPMVVGNTVYVAAELIRADDPDCVGNPVTFTEAVFVSKDGGNSWTAGAKIPITSSTQGFGAFVVGPGQFVRNLEFPTLAALKTDAFIAWNDGGDGSGHSHIRYAKLDGSGNVTGNPSFITSGGNDELQPAMSGDSSGLHVAYYQISTASNGNGQFDVIVSNSNGSGNGGWRTQRVTSQSFPGVFTVPQFDPIIAFGYMGDYIAIASDGGHQYMAWGDNRDTVNNFMWPGGRNDPDVFSARQ